MTPTKPSKRAGGPLTIRAARVTPAQAVSEQDAQQGAQPRMEVVLQVENTSAEPLHLWTSTSLL